MAVYAFDDLIEAITNAVVRANLVAEQQHLRLLPAEGEENIFFERDENTRQLRAKTIEVTVPSPGNGTGGEASELIQVPVVSMIPLNSLQISNLTVEFRAYISGIDEAGSTQVGEEAKGKKRLYLALKKRLFRRQKEVNVKITLTNTAPAEGEIRINEEILKQVPL